MPRFTKKPVEIEAFQFLDETTGHAIEQWAAAKGVTVVWFPEMEERVEGDIIFPASPELLAVQTLEGTMTALVGHYIICGVGRQGPGGMVAEWDIYPVDPEIFDRTYDPSDDEIVGDSNEEVTG